MSDTDTTTTTATAPDIAAVTTTVDTYLASLHELDPAKRAELVAQAWVDEGHFVDPLQEAEGHTALGEIAPAVQQFYPGYRFRRTSDVDTHHNFVRFGWELADPDGTVAVAGIDVAMLAPDGRIQTLVGFFGDLTAA